MLANNNKVFIIPDNSDPLWQEIKVRFHKEVKSPPDPRAPDTQNFYYRATRGKLKVTDFNWYILDDTLLLREKKKDED